MGRGLQVLCAYLSSRDLESRKETTIVEGVRHASQARLKTSTISVIETIARNNHNHTATWRPRAARRGEKERVGMEERQLKLLEQGRSLTGSYNRRGSYITMGVVTFLQSPLHDSRKKIVRKFPHKVTWAAIQI
jgi:hypothetical protein